MIDVNNILKGLTSSPAAKGFLGGIAGGAATSALTSKKGRKGAVKSVKYGGVAAVGAIAWKAYKQYSNKSPQDQQQFESNGSAAIQQQPQIQQDPNWQGLQASNFRNLEVAENAQEQAQFIIKSMVAAAMADGHVDATEYQKILSKADEIGLSLEEKNMLLAEMAAPMKLEQVIGQCNCPQLALEVYTASHFAVDENLKSGRAYLDNLANGLQIPIQLVRAVEEQSENL